MNGAHKDILRRYASSMDVRLATRLYLVLVILSLLLPIANFQMDDIEVDASEVKNWALRFGKSIAEGSSEATCLRKIEENYKDNKAKVLWVEIPQMLEEMRIDLKNMLGWKRDAVHRIAEVAESTILTHSHDSNLKFEYYNAKKLYGIDEKDVLPEGWKQLKLEYHHNFDVPVNILHSSIHVPTNVYDKGPELLNAIKWSEYLNPVFRNNLAADPTLNWQYFGSSLGFLRTYPGTKWPWSGGEEKEPDFYDCRMQPWYIQAATSAKDIIILLDSSGSMIGLRQKIAFNIVSTILDTLNANDYVTILNFNDSIQSVVPCFDSSLVQANARNTQKFKDALEKVNTTGVANFTLSLTTAFELLQKYNRTGQGSQCNQAIMLVTDGAPQTYEEIFRRYNWPNIPVRVFTYLVGLEVGSEVPGVNFMACKNKGYFTHISRVTEIQEKVQKYIPVMSRPIVLSGIHPVIWTGVYADAPGTVLSERIWMNKHYEKFEEDYFIELKKKPKIEDAEEQLPAESETPDDDDDEYDQIISAITTTDSPSTATATADTSDEDSDEEPEEKSGLHKKRSAKKVQLMTTVAIPIIDKRNTSQHLANLLGVAGVDVPIDEIMKLTPAYKLGVNGYSFAITNNGHTLYHPDLRPMFGDVLKPGYRSVDLTEVESVVGEMKHPWDFDEELLAIRKNMIDRRIGWGALNVKIHYDDMQRVVTRNNSYYYGPIENTPFSIAISLPDPYGHYRVHGQVEVKTFKEDWINYFQGNNWRVHPDWVYCDIRSTEGGEKLTPEQVIRTFLNETLKGNKFRWRTTSTFPPLFDQPICEKDLIQSLVFDAKVTDIDPKICAPPAIPSEYDGKIRLCQFAKGKTSCTSEDITKCLLGEGKKLCSRENMIKMYGIINTFVATRSGLLRVEEHLNEDKGNNEKPFKDTHTRAINELFYKRAVDFYYINSSAFVFSVPHDAGAQKGTKVTGSHAIFLGSEKRVAPAAVVGLQFQHSVFRDRFLEITSKCMQNCRFNCKKDELDCYLLDDNGFVVVSETDEHTGKFYGEIDFSIFNSLINYGFYKRVDIYDYQAVCFESADSSGPASFLLNPFHHMRNILMWFWNKLAVLLIHYSLYGIWSHEGVFATDYSFTQPDYEELLSDNQTRKPMPCEKEIRLYEMQKKEPSDPIKGRLSMCGPTGCDKQFIAHPVPYTNLLMVVVYKICHCETDFVKLTGKTYTHNMTEKCLHMKSGLYRQRPNSCTNYHAGENEIKECGRGSNISASIFLLFIAFVLSRHVLI